MADNPYAPDAEAAPDRAPTRITVNPYAPEPSTLDTAKDIAKQAGAGILSGIEAGATFVPSVIGAVAGYLDPELGERQRMLREKYGEPGIAGMLPKAATPAGTYTRTAAEFVPGFVQGGIRRGLGETWRQFFAREAPGMARRAAGGAATGVASEAAGQATEGTILEPVARVGAALAGGRAIGAAERGAANRALTQRMADTEAAGNRGYDAFRNAGFSFHPYATSHFSVPTRSHLVTEGFEETAPRVFKALEGIEAKPFTSPQDLQGAYKRFGSIAKAAENPEERRAAYIAQERLLQFAENPPPWVIGSGDPAAGVAQLREANANWAALKRAEDLGQRITKAEDRAAAKHSGMGLENELRQKFEVMANTPRPGSSDAEREAFRRFARGSVPQNAGRLFTNFAGGRGGIASTVGGGVLGSAGLALGQDPYTAAAIGVGTPTLALLGQLARNRQALGRARNLQAMVLNRSPYAEAHGALQAPPSWLRSATFGARPTLENLGGE